MRSLRRCREFRSENRRSALHDDSVTEPIKKRLLDLLSLFLSEGLIAGEEIAEQLDFRRGTSIADSSDNADPL